MNYQDKVRLERLREELATVEPAHLRELEKLVANLPKVQPDSAKQRLLKHYAEREPKTFYQLDGFTKVEEDYVFSPDDDGDSVLTSVTEELMTGNSVLRVLITEGATKEEAVRLLKKILGILLRASFVWHDGELRKQYNYYPELSADFWSDEPQLPDFEPKGAISTGQRFRVFTPEDEDLPF